MSHHLCGDSMSCHLCGNSIMSCHLCGSIMSHHLCGNSIMSHHLCGNSIMSHHLCGNSIMSHHLCGNSNMSCPPGVLPVPLVALHSLGSSLLRPDRPHNGRLVPATRSDTLRPTNHRTHSEESCTLHSDQLIVAPPG